MGYEEKVLFWFFILVNINAPLAVMINSVIFYHIWRNCFRSLVIFLQKIRRTWFMLSRFLLIQSEYGLKWWNKTIVHTLRIYMYLKTNFWTNVVTEIFLLFSEVFYAVLYYFVTENHLKFKKKNYSPHYLFAIKIYTNFPLRDFQQHLETTI